MVKRRSAKDERPLQAYGVDSIRAESLSGRLSREQVAANEFARRVGVKRGVGLAPAAMAEWRRRNKGREGQQAGEVREGGRRRDGTGRLLLSCIAIVLRPLTLASLRCRNEARRVFTNQAEGGVILCMTIALNPLASLHCRRGRGEGGGCCCFCLGLVSFRWSARVVEEE